MEKLKEMEVAFTTAGYRIMEGEDGFFWETDLEASEDFFERTDVVDSAHKHLLENSIPAPV